MQLESLFDSTIRLRLIKVFIRNADAGFAQNEIAKKIQIRPNSIKSHLKNLLKLGLIKTKIQKNKRIFSLNQKFLFYPELKNLILKESPIFEEKILPQLKKIGQIKLVIVAGLFINSEKKRVDFLIVGDKIKKSTLYKLIKDLEVNAGKEIEYAIFTTKEFKYRQKMFDRFIIDILEYPHKKLLNKLKV